MASGGRKRKVAEPLTYADDVKGRLLKTLEKMTDEISPANFDEIFKKLGESGIEVKNIDEIVQTFKQNLYQGIADNFNDMWEKNEIEIQLNVLNYLKEKCKDNTTSWRSTGKTPEEQTQYLRSHYLKKKIGFVRGVIEAQTLSLEKMFKEVREHRVIVEQMIDKQDYLSKQMDMRMVQINEPIFGAVQHLQMNSEEK